MPFGDPSVMAPRGIIFGCAGPKLMAREARFFAKADPWGYILFARNIETPAQLRALTADLRAAVGRDAPILIDQEGGRVARMTPPHWTPWTNALAFAQTVPPQARVQAMRLRYQVIALELSAVGIDVNCAPMADTAWAQTHPDIRERCYSADPAEVTKLARAVSDGLMAGGVLPILKHMPGHGRTPLDSHADLPKVTTQREVLEATDFMPFRALADLPMAMTSHIVFDALDPSAPVTLSASGIGYLRKMVGFGGLLLTDDLSMGALQGPMAQRVRGAFDAGCDIALHCNGDPDEMAEAAEAAPRLAGTALVRTGTVLTMRAAMAPEPAQIPDLLAQIRNLTTEVSHA